MKEVKTLRQNVRKQKARAGSLRRRVQPTLAEQIEAVEEHIRINVHSHTHLIGRYRGTIPPGPWLDETNALKAAAKSLRRLNAALCDGEPNTP